MNTNQLQQKRQLFRINIRRKQLQAKFCSIRAQYTQSQYNLHRMNALVNSNYFYNIKQKMNQFFYQIYQQLKEKDYARCIQALQSMHNLIMQQKSNYSASQNPRNEDQQQKWRELLTISLNQVFRDYSKNLSQLIIQVLQGKELSESDEDQQNQNMFYVIQKKVQQKVCEAAMLSEEDKQLIYKNAFSLLSLAYPNLLQADLCQRIIQSLWKIWNSFQLPLEINHSLEEERKAVFYLQYLLIFLNFVLCSMEQRIDEKKKHIFQYILSIGIFQQMRHIIQYIIQLRGQLQPVCNNQTIELMIHEAHLKITDFLLLFYRQKQQNRWENSFQQYLFQHFASYGLYLLNYIHNINMINCNLNQIGQSSRQLLLNVIYLLINIKSQNEEIISSIDLTNFVVLQYTIREEMQMRWDDQYSLNIIIGIFGIFSILTQQASVMKQLVQQYNLVGFLEHSFLNLFKYFQSKPSLSNIKSHLTTKFLNMVSNIVRNILRGANKYIKNYLLAHNFMKILFDQISKDPARLFPLLRIFPSYFLSMGRKVTLNNLHIMLQAVSNMNLSQQKEKVLQVKCIIKTVYSNSEGYVAEEELSRIQGMYEAYGLKQFLDDFQ